jgi:hypothetical protein
MKKVIEHLENICSVCGGHLLSINFLPRNGGLLHLLLKAGREIMPTPQGWERNYAYL